jgi:hypothetical protein
VGATVHHRFIHFLLSDTIISMIRTVAILLTPVLNAFLSIPLAGEDHYLWKHEVNTMQDIISSGFSNVELFGDYYESLPLTALLSLLGQLVLYSSFLFKEKSNAVVVTGIVTLWIALGSLMIRGLLFSLLLGSLPFIIVSIVLCWLTTKQKNITKANY